MNVLMRWQGVRLSLTALSTLGVKRSAWAVHYVALLGAFLPTREMRDYGTFSFAAGVVDPKEINAVFTT